MSSNDPGLTKKRPFERDGALLMDRYEEENGRYADYQIPAECFDEPVTAGDNGPEGVPGPERPAKSLDFLLASLETGTWSTPTSILRFVDDPRVRPALAEATERIPGTQLLNFAHALGLAGGDDACRVLRVRLDDLLNDKGPLLREPSINDDAFTICSVATALLRLDPQALDAARALVWLFKHPSAINRQDAVRGAAEVLRPEMSTAAMRHLKDAMCGLRDEDDDGMFLHAAPLLARDDFEAVQQRCLQILNDGDYLLKQWAAVALSRIPIPHTAQALASLVRWLPGRPLSLSLWVVSLVGPFVPEAIAVEVVRHGLASTSPMLRFEALASAHALDSRLARPLLEEALLDEPDPALRRKFQQRLKELE